MNNSRSAIAKKTKQRSLLTSEIGRLIKRAYPIGCRIEYEHGNYTISATVFSHSYGERVKVVGRTGKKYWIEINRILP